MISYCFARVDLDGTAMSLMHRAVRRMRVCAVLGTLTETYPFARTDTFLQITRDEPASLIALFHAYCDARCLWRRHESLCGRRGDFEKELVGKELLQQCLGSSLWCVSAIARRRERKLSIRYDISCYYAQSMAQALLARAKHSLSASWFPDERSPRPWRTARLPTCVA